MTDSQTPTAHPDYHCLAIQGLLSSLCGSYQKVSWAVPLISSWGLQRVSWGVAVPSACLTGYLKTGRYLVGGYASLLGSVFSRAKSASSWLMGKQAQR